MYYKLMSEPLPTVTEIDKIVRKTTWRCADRRNILAFIEEGACYFAIDGKSLLLQKGQALLIPAETPYVRRPYENTVCTIFYLHFLTEGPLTSLDAESLREEAAPLFERIKGGVSRSYEGSFAPEPIYLDEVMSLGENEDEIFSVIRAMRNEVSAKTGVYANLKISLLFMRVLSLLSAEVLTQARISHFRQNETYPIPLQKALLYVQKRYKQKISSEEMARAANVSVQHLIRLFRKYLNTTPIGYVNRTRVLHAIDLLRNTDLTVKEIAYESGFEDPNYFSRLFKREEKMSPGETRSRIRNYAKEKKPSPVKE